eukprot:CAMPEP_0194250576 /NCGR_PEP_ID=MMETSP0158-20130606/23427_1 /TAXON_ID=33649 /ORGANISM="Thalassionema nitzschioides, Strain L26-B" /LENGTH=434 /DNA_ID=CAMNT_0038987437 /DNA_START=68 /DNA_END=1369 /DNA_ORIENTATION=+
MTSIPADPGLVLGNIVETWRVEQLQAIAQLQAPVDLANDRLNSLSLSSYKIEMVYQQMVNMRVDVMSLVKIQTEMVALKAEAAEAAIDLAVQVMTSEKAIRSLKAKIFRQTKISEQVESPMNYELSQIQQFPLSFDSMKFDVQFFQVQQTADASTAHASDISAHVASTFQKGGSGGGVQAGMNAAASAHSTTMAQMNSNSVEGTVVITAFCTHKQTDMISPFVMDPEKAVRAWNECNPEDYLSYDAPDMWKAALVDTGIGSMQILSGAAKSSSFVAYVHILKTEQTTQNSSTSSVAASVAATVESHMFGNSLSGGFGMSKQQSSSVSNMLSTANLTSNCSLQCEGVIPSIVSNEVKTTVQNMNPDTSQVMGQLNAIADASAVDTNGGMEAAAGNAATGSQFQALNNGYVTNVVSSLGEEQRLSNQVIDTNSMMT